MKKIFSIVSLALLLVLAACNTNTVKSNARAVASNYTTSSQSVTFKLEVRDPEKELENRVFDVKVVDTLGKTTIVEDQTIEASKTKTIEIKGLERLMEYKLIVVGTKDGKDFELLNTANAFKTLAQGDVEADPLMIKTVQEFKDMNAKKHYRLANDLDFNNESMTPLFSAGTPFNGSFDGANFTIKNINITAEADVNKQYLSVFGYASKSVIKNVNFDNVNIDNSAKAHTARQYVGIIVSRVSSNEFILENIKINNSNIKVSHNINQSTLNRDLYVGLIGGSLQGKIANVEITNSEVLVKQGGINQVGTGSSDAAVSGTYVGGAIGLVELDKGVGISKIAVINTEVNVEITQDKKANASGVLYVGGIFGAYRGDGQTTDLYSSADITVKHVKHGSTESTNLDNIHIGGITAILHKANAVNLYFDGSINVDLTDSVKLLNIALITPVAGKASSKVLASGSINVVTATQPQTNAVTEIYGYSSTGLWNKFDNVKMLRTPQVVIDGNNVSFTNYQSVTSINAVIDSEFILSKVNS